MSYYSERNNYINNKVKVVLDLSSYDTKKELNEARGVDTSYLVVKREKSL